MAKYEYTEDDVLFRMREAEEYKGRKGWFGNNTPEAYEAACKGDKNSRFYGTMVPGGYMSHPFRRKEDSQVYEVFVLEYEATYEERQAEWVEENNIKVGDMVKVVNLDGYPEGEDAPEIGKTYKVFDIWPKSIALRRYESDPPDESVKLFGVLYTQLEKVVEPEWKVGDWFRTEDGHLYQVKRVEREHLTADGHGYFGKNEVAKVHFEPFNLSDPEVRKSLRGKWLKNKNSNDGEETMIIGFAHTLDTQDRRWAFQEEWYCELPYRSEVKVKDLFEKYTFLDGTPCGKEVEG